MHRSNARRRAVIVLILTLLSSCASSEPAPSALPAGAGEVETREACGTPDSTFAGIQRSVFEVHGCTRSACHGAEQPQAGLQLTADVAYHNLVHTPAQASDSARPGMRVVPGRRAQSLLYRKLAALTHGEPLPAELGAPMPAGGATPVSATKLEAIGLWIVAGAPERGVVIGTEALLNCDLPEPGPLKIPAPAPPPSGLGHQLAPPAWELPPGGEDEVCFATYYDLTGRAPEDAVVNCPDAWGGVARRCVSIGDSSLSQDPQSHHGNVYAYFGAANANDPGWGGWLCTGGADAGRSCDPTKLGVPADEGGAECGEGGACTTVLRSAPACVGWGPTDLSGHRIQVGGAQGLKGTFEKPDGVYAVVPQRGFMVWNSHGFNLTRQATTIAQYLNLYYAGPEQRRYLYRPIFDDADILQVLVAPFAEREICRTLTLERGARLLNLIGHMHKRGRLFRIWDPPQKLCRAVDADCVAPAAEPFYTSTRYDDQTVLTYDTPRAFDQESAEERSLRYCVVYDNGHSDASRVKRRSTSPPVPGGLAPGGPCSNEQVVCLGGDQQGALCQGHDAVCSNGGVCDACPLRGGVTTEDEMLLLIGGYYLAD